MDNNRGWMNGSALISVVVPVYNVEAYLEDCLNSLLGQSFKDIEIIVVDDGSTDASPDICARFVGKDDRVRYFRKKNGGLSSARNYGISRATGSYLMYVDSDDLIAPYMIEHLYHAIVELGADVSICGFEIFHESAELDIFTGINPFFQRITASRALELLYSEQSSGCSAWAKLAKIDLWEKVEFPEGRRFEDFPRINRLFKGATKVAVTNTPMYYYRKRADSITAFLDEASARDLLCSIEEFDQLDIDGDSGLAKAKAFKIALECSRLMGRIDDASEPFNQALRVLQRMIVPALRAPYAGVLQKIRIGMIALFPYIGVRISRRVLK